MLTNKEFLEISQFVKLNYGINLTEKKRALVAARLENYIVEKSYDSFSSYMNAVRSDESGNLMKEFLNRITTNHSYFWREKEHFEYFRNEVLPYLKKVKKDRDLRIWSAGCSSGQEAYTLAMIIDDFFGKEKTLWNTQILATDISDKVLAVARTGSYKKDDVMEVPNYYYKKYFDKLTSTEVNITNKLKDEVLFRRLNLLSDYRFKKNFDVIFCRNVMIYFDFQTKHEIMKKFYNVLDSGGHLFIGHSESIDRNIVPFKYVKPSIYVK
ncbi:MAG: protein-glutamate O-methyltransferase CheR [Tissierellales bacterium]|jgi:chemotaxis protein methyltransferase CheR|nr:protein-glutamate O-methyltransferase CheR [Tissierellales bacterium]